ncbi:MAG: DUF3365 domain-containing protein [Gemmatimonadota bacterium]
MDRLAKGLLALLLTLTAAACGGSEDDEVSPEIEAAVFELGSSASQALMGTLVTQLTGAMQEGGAAHAVDFCSTSAFELTAGVAQEQGLDVKRTSMKYRNPANAPDEDETEALRYYESALAETGVLPGPLVRKAGRDEYRFYRPLVVAAPCLGCHGSTGEIDPTVQAILVERYPDDLATGYAAGDFRGVIRVSVPADRVEDTGD